MYKEGARTAVADALSRIGTTGVTTEHEDESIPCFTTHFNVEGVLKSEGGGSEICSNKDDDFATFDMIEEAHVVWVIFLTLTAHVEVESEDEVPRQIAIEEMLREQSTDEECKEIRAQIDEGVPKSLRTSEIKLAQKTLIAAHPGVRRIYMTLRAKSLLAVLTLDCYRTVRNYIECAR